MSRRRLGAVLGIVLACIVITGFSIQYYLYPQLTPTVPVPAGDIPTVYAQDYEFDKLSFHVYANFYIYLGASNRMSFTAGVDVTNLSNATIDDICFVKMTVYWESLDFNFTTELESPDGPIENVTLDSEESIFLELVNFHTWTSDIPGDVYTGLEKNAYGRILVSFNTIESCIISTNLAVVSLVSG